MKRVLLLTLLVLPTLSHAQDMPLSQVLLPGESWHEVTKLEGTPGTILADGRGQLYVADAEKPIIRSLDAEGNMRGFWTPSGVAAGMCLDREGRLYVAVPERRRIVRFDEKKAEAVVQENLDAVDVVFLGGNLKSGHLYYSSPKTKSIHRAGRNIAVARNLAHPSGLVAWADGGTVVVGERDGRHLLTYRLRGDGTLDAPERYYTLRTQKTQPSGVRQMTIDSAKRLYAATREGVQVFDPTGRMSGVLLSPRRAPVTALAFVGDRLYIVCDGKLWWRKTKTRGLDQ